MLTIIDRGNPRVEARWTTLLRYAHTSVRLLRARVGARGKRSGRREGEKEGIGVQNVGEKDGENREERRRRGEDSGGFSRRDGRCADITDK